MAYVHQIEVLGELAGSCGRKIQVHCKLDLPADSSSRIGIELSVPGSSMPAPALENPCQFVGTAGDRRIALDNVWYRRLTTSSQPNLTWRRHPADLTHVGSLTITTTMAIETDAVPKNSATLLFHVTTPEFFKSLPAWNRCRPEDKYCKLTAVQVPELGELAFYKEWSHHFEEHGTRFTAAAQLYGRIEVAGFSLEQLNDHISQVKRSLRLLALFGRQQIQVVSVTVVEQFKETQHYIDPLDPLSPPYLPYEPCRYLIDPKDFAVLGTKALATYASLRSHVQEGIDHLVVSVAPFQRLPTSLQFTNLMHSFDAYDLWTSPAEQHLSDSDRLLIGKLSELLVSFQSGEASEAAALAAERTQGFIARIKQPAKNLANKMREFAVERSDVTNGLWPLTGTKTMPGLVQLRDRLAHKGPMGVDHQALAVGLWHLSVFAERVALNLLGIDVNDSNVTPGHLRNEAWLSPEYRKVQQRAAFR